MKITVGVVETDIGSIGAILMTRRRGDGDAGIHQPAWDASVAGPSASTSRATSRSPTR